MSKVKSLTDTKNIVSFNSSLNINADEIFAEYSEHDIPDSEKLNLYIDRLSRDIGDHDTWSSGKEVSKEVFAEVQHKVVNIAIRYNDLFSENLKVKVLKDFGKEASEYLINTLGWEVDCDAAIRQINDFPFDDTDKLVQDNVFRYFTNHPEQVISLKYQNLGAPEQGYTVIPPILHHIWITTPDVRRQITDENLENAKKMNALFESSEVHDWQQIIWVNDKSLVQPSIEALQDTNIEIREFGEIKEFLPNYDLIMEHTEQKHWGVASDTLRYDLVNYMGGVYADIDYVFARIPDSEINKYNFFAPNHGKGASMNFLVENFMFASSANHTIIQHTQAITRKNLVDPNPDHPSINGFIDFFTDYATAHSLSYGYLRGAQQQQNIDVILPTCALHGGECNADHTYSPLSSEPYYDSLRENQKEFIWQYCPALIDSIEPRITRDEMEAHARLNELCPAEEAVIGEDGAGRTWFDH